CYVFYIGVLFGLRWFMQEDPDRVSGCRPGITGGGLVEARHGCEDCRFTSSVGSDHTDLGAGEKGHGYVVKNDLIANFFAGFDHLINKFGHGLYSSRLRQQNVILILLPQRVQFSANIRLSSVRVLPSLVRSMVHHCVFLPYAGELWCTE